MGVYGTSTCSITPSAEVGLLVVTDVSAFAPVTANSGPDVVHAAIPKKATATTYRRFIDPPALSSNNNQS